jgi:LysR family hydrogen peroxide-inducible transcriptional activator
MISNQVCSEHRTFLYLRRVHADRIASMPTLRQLEYLIALADTLHFRRAAERVHATQPTVSEQLQALERRLGIQLVERSRSKVLITAIGLEVVTIVRRVLRDIRRIRDITGNNGYGLTGVIRLGLISSVGPYFLSRVVPELHARYPQLKLYAREELPHELFSELDDGVHDVIIAPSPVSENGLKQTVIFDEPLYLTVPVNHGLAKRDNVRVKDLANVEFLALGPGHQLQEVVVDLAAEVGAKVRFDYEGTSLDTLREMMAAGLGVSILPGLYVRGVIKNDSRFKIFDIRGLHLRRTIGMFWRKTKTGHEHLMRLAAIFRETVASEFKGLAGWIALITGTLAFSDPTLLDPNVVESRGA